MLCYRLCLVDTRTTTQATKPSSKSASRRFGIATATDVGSTTPIACPIRAPTTPIAISSRGASISHVLARFIRCIASLDA